MIVFRGEDQSRLQTQLIISLLMNAILMNRPGYVAFQMAAVAILRNLFADILRLIAELRSPPGPLRA